MSRSSAIMLLLGVMVLAASSLIQSVEDDWKFDSANQNDGVTVDLDDVPTRHSHHAPSQHENHARPPYQGNKCLHGSTNRGCLIFPPPPPPHHRHWDPQTL